MNAIQLLLAEIGYRKLNFALAFMAIAVAVTLFVAGPVLLEHYSRQTQAELQTLETRVAESQQRVAQAEHESAEELAKMEDETRKLMRALGFNLMLVHRDTDVVPFLANRLPTIDMPQDYVQRLAKDKRLSLVTHLVGVLRAKIAWEGRDVQLAGYLPEIPQSHMRHESPMGYDVQPGTALLGYQLGKQREVGQTIQVLGKPLRIAQILPEQGTDEDATIAVHLSDAQALLAKPAKINMILALECKCTENALPQIRKQLEGVLPETQVLRDTSKAVARAKQRELVAEKHQQIVARQKEVLEERKQALAETAARRKNVQQLMAMLVEAITPLVVLTMAVWVGLLALANVRERRTEIGLLRAIGKSSGFIAVLFLGKAIALGLLGAAVGFALGSGLAYGLAARAMHLSAADVGLRYDLLLGALLGAPLVSAIASYLPTLSAIVQDPAVVLTEQ